MFIGQIKGYKVHADASPNGPGSDCELRLISKREQNSQLVLIRLFWPQNREIWYSQKISTYTVIQIKKESRHAWPTFIWVIALFWNLVFLTFWNFGTWICHDIMQIKFGFVTLGLLLQELLTFAKIQFPGFFSAAFWDIELKFSVWIYFGLTRSSLSFVKLDLLLQELLSFTKIYFLRLFHAVFWDFDLKQIKFQFICFRRSNAS